MSTQKKLDDFYKSVNGKLIISFTASKKSNMEIRSVNETVVISSDDESEIFKGKKIIGKKAKIKHKRIINKQCKNNSIPDSSSSFQTSTDLSPSKRQRIENNETLVDKKLVEIQLSSPKKLINTVNKTSHLSSLNSNCLAVYAEIYSQNSSFVLCKNEGGGVDSDETNYSDYEMVDSTTEKNTTDISSSEFSLSQTKSTQSEEEYFSTELDNEAESSVNLSQASDMTEEYDVNEYEETIQEFLKSKFELNTTITLNNFEKEPCKNDSCLENLSRSAVQENSLKKRNIVKNLFPTNNEKHTKQIQVDFSQETISLPCNSVTFRTIKRCVATQVRANEIIEETNRELVKNMQENSKTTSKNPSLSSPSKTLDGSNKIFKKNIEKRKTIDDEIPKTDNRYSEENHQRLCTNIHHITGWVLERFGIVLTRANTTIIHSLLNLENMLYKAFVLRLYTRKDNWYNFDDLCRILKITLDRDERVKMLDVLQEKKLIDTDLSKESVASLLNLLNRPQIKDICVQTKINKTPSKKNDMINALLKNSNRQLTLTSLKTSDEILRDRIKNKLGFCLKLSPETRDILNKVHTLYTLANPELETPNDIYFLLNRMHFEQIRYPRVTIDIVEIFRTNFELDAYIQAVKLRKEFEEEIKNKVFENCYLLAEEAHRRAKHSFECIEEQEMNKDKPVYLRRFSASWVYCSVVSVAAMNLGKAYPNESCQWLKFLLKQKFYCVRKRGRWYEQLALVKQSHLKNVVEAVEEIISGLNDRLVSEVSQHELSSRGRKIRKATISSEKHEHLQACLLPEFDPFPSRTFQCNIVHGNVQGRKKSYVRQTDSGKEYGSVEETAISLYAEEKFYTHGIHCEGRIFYTIFYLLFWDIIYTLHIPNTFISNIQTCPLDMFSGEFYKNRKKYIDKRIDDVSDVWTIDDLCEYVINVWSKHEQELISLSIFNNFEDEDQLESIIRCIGKKTIAAVCKRFSKDFALYKAGLPDLFLWNPQENRCCFVEVKSEKDKLSTKQILWLNYLKKIGAKVEVCYIQDIGSRSARKTRRKVQEKE